LNDYFCQTPTGRQLPYSLLIAKAVGWFESSAMISFRRKRSVADTQQGLNVSLLRVRVRRIPADIVLDCRPHAKFCTACRSSAHVAIGIIMSVNQIK
jgi:hypothetical protein